MKSKTKNKPATPLTDSINKLIERLTEMEVDEVKGNLWKIFATLAIQEDKTFAVEFLAEDRGELIAILEKKKRWSHGVAQDAVLEFFYELQTVVSSE